MTLLAAQILPLEHPGKDAHQEQELLGEDAFTGTLNEVVYV